MLGRVCAKHGWGMEQLQTGAADSWWEMLCGDVNASPLGKLRADLGAFGCLVTKSIVSHVFMVLKGLCRLLWGRLEVHPVTNCKSCSGTSPLDSDPGTFIFQPCDQEQVT